MLQFDSLINLYFNEIDFCFVSGYISSCYFQLQRGFFFLFGTEFEVHSITFMLQEILQIYLISHYSSNLYVMCRSIAKIINTAAVYIKSEYFHFQKKYRSDCLRRFKKFNDD